MPSTSIIPKADVDHILDVFSDLAERPETLDIDGTRVASKLLQVENLTVLVDDVHVEFTFSGPEGQMPRINSISCGMYTDLDLVTDASVYPEARFTLYRESGHSLSWGDATTTQDVVTSERMAGMLRIVSRMKGRMAGLFDDETMA